MYLESAKRGDTLIEVVLAFAMFSLVAVISIAVMNSSISGAEASLELTLARTEIDSQAETLRFVHESFADNMGFANLWYKIINQNVDNSKLPDLDATDCDNLYEDAGGNATIYGAKAFVVNPRKIVNGLNEAESDYYQNTLIVASDNTTSGVKFQPAVLNPRVIYTLDSASADDPATSDDVLSEKDPSERYDRVSLVEGLYDMVVAGQANNSSKPPHYDFYIYTCWVPAGAKRPTTIGTVLRLFNPEFIDQ